MATKKKSSNPLNTKNEWTIDEFKMWLSGAESIQGEDWIPNHEQWGMIKEIIYKLKDRGVVKKPLSSPNLPPPPMHGGMQPPVPAPGAPIGSSLLSIKDAVPEEANLPLSELRRRRELGNAGGPSNQNLLTGNGGPGEKEIKTGTFE